MYSLALWSVMMLQARQDIAQEYEIVKDICETLTSLKSDTPKVGVIGSEARQYEEPTRDPDVWPPPTPVEHRLAVTVATGIFPDCFSRLHLEQK